MKFLGTRSGWNYRPGHWRRISEATDRRSAGEAVEVKVEERNRMKSGGANYFTLGQVSPAYRYIDYHAAQRLRPWLCRKHKVRSGKWVRFSDVRLHKTYGLVPLASTTRSLPWAKA